MRRRHDFERVWPEVEEGLRRVMAARNIPRSEWDDLVQEVAARTLACDIEFQNADDLLRWAATVLRRLHVDLLRRTRRQSRGALLTQLEPGVGVDRQAIARVELATVAEVVATWSPEARATLLQNDDDVGTRQPSAFYVRRHRLRARLLAAIEGSGILAPIGALRSRLRVFDWRRMDASLMEQATAAAALLVPPVAAACLSIALGTGAAAGEPSRSVAQAAVAGARASLHAAGVPHAVPPARGTTDAAASGSADVTASAVPGGSPHEAGERLVRWPIEAEAEVAYGSKRASTEVEDSNEPQPLLCTGGEAVPAHCIPHPLYEGPAAGIVPPPT